jgi:hypothetical protein
VGPGGADAGQAELITSNLFDHPPGGRGGGDLAEQLRLVPQGRQVAEAVATVGQQHRKIPQHPAGLMAMPRRLGSVRPPAQRGGQPEPVGQLRQQRRPGMADHTGAVGGDFEACMRPGSLHPQGALLERWMRPSASRILPAQGGTCATTAAPHKALAKNRG